MAAERTQGTAMAGLRTARSEIHCVRRTQWYRVLTWSPNWAEEKLFILFRSTSPSTVEFCLFHIFTPSVAIAKSYDSIGMIVTGYHAIREYREGRAGARPYRASI